MFNKFSMIFLQMKSTKNKPPTSSLLFTLQCDKPFKDYMMLLIKTETQNNVNNKVDQHTQYLPASTLPLLLICSSALWRPALAHSSLSQPCCLLRIIRVVSMLLFSKVSRAFWIVASGSDRLRLRIQAKSTWKRRRTSVHEYTSAVLT